MYNFDGIYFVMKSRCTIFAIIGVVSLVGSLFWNPSKRDKKILITGIACCFIAISFWGYYKQILRQPQILFHEGYILSENRAWRSILGEKYTFTNINGSKPIFYLDFSSKKEICPGGFIENQMYRIYYEKESKIIVKVDELG